MITRSFFGLFDPKLLYDVLQDENPDVVEVELSDKVILLLDTPFKDMEPLLLKTGDQVRTGEKLKLFENSDAYVISSITGKITAISSYSGDFGQEYCYIQINADNNEAVDDTFRSFKRSPSLKSSKEYLSFLPGLPPLRFLTGPQGIINTIVINAVDSDLLTVTNQYILKNEIDSILDGIEILKEISGLTNIFLVIPEHMKNDIDIENLNIITLNAPYPSAQPKVILKEFFGINLTEGKSCENYGFTFFQAESVAAISNAYKEGIIPVTKYLTLITPEGGGHLVKAKIGTPILDIVKKFNLKITDNDRVIIGGPMTGFSAYTLLHPVQPNTSAIVIQSSEEIPEVSTYPCVNCGKCVRSCPAGIQVNMLIRYLEAAKYEEAFYNYELGSCIDCGLCSYVCISRIPIFQYIRLGKFKLSQMNIITKPEIIVDMHCC